LEIQRSIVIDRPVGEVFEFVANARNDPRWCPKVDSTEQVAGEGPGPGSRYLTIHRPVPLRPAREMEHGCVDWNPPQRIEWLQDDGVDRFEVTYELEEVPAGTRLSQRSEARLGVPRLLHPIWRRGIGNDIERQLRTLKGLLEHGS
jgi:Polyketide cyclase / dehydrase and lipid transport